MRVILLHTITQVSSRCPNFFRARQEKSPGRKINTAFAPISYHYQLSMSCQSSFPNGNKCTPHFDPTPSAKSPSKNNVSPKKLALATTTPVSSRGQGQQSKRKSNLTAENPKKRP